MPRGGSFKSSSSKSYSLSKPTISSSYSSPSTAVQQHNVKVEQPGFFSNMIQGLALGTGQSFAFNLFRSNPSPSSTPVVQTQTSIESSLTKEFVKCMTETNNDKEACKHYLD